MSSLNEVCEGFNAFVEEAKLYTDLYEKEEVGKIFYSALLLKERSDGLVGFGPRDIWNTSNEELIKLLKKLREDVRTQAKNT